MAAARGKNESGAESWYTIRAVADNAADISIYDEIGGWGISAHWFAEELVALGSITQINLHIHSPGGSIFDGLAIYNLLKNHPARKWYMWTVWPVRWRRSSRWWATPSSCRKTR